MKKFDELEVNAFIDGELTSAERMELLDQVSIDPQLARATCDATYLKSQVQLAYAEPPGLHGACPNRRIRSRLALVATLVLLIAGSITGGWMLGHTPGSGERFVMLDAKGLGQAPATADSGETRIVFHLTNPDQTVAGELLDEVERMLEAYESEGKPLRVEIVSNGDGLDLLRQRLSHYPERIHQMASRFDNLTFVACKNTIDRVEVSEGIEVRILPDAQVIGSGVDHVVRRQQQGWAYIRV